MKRQLALRQCQVASFIQNEIYDKDVYIRESEFEQRKLRNKLEQSDQEKFELKKQILDL